ncbi:MAG TPA: hypothetical protein VM866_05475, partial [Pyrinomonadaceae bacterium]|nr:hypothetical protein [Pyrinomonadaceae bacterium]
AAATLMVDAVSALAERVGNCARGAAAMTSKKIALRIENDRFIIGAYKFSLGFAYERKYSKVLPPAKSKN